MNRRQVIWGGIALAAAGTFGTIAYRFRRDMGTLRTATTGHSQVIDTRSGILEYAEAGCGPPVLMIHGTGGGFDQGLLFAAPLAQRGWRVIAPSRFGYLGSDFPRDASSEAQADALVDLLDHLAIDRLPVIGGSAGALSALQVAIRHPNRCSALLPLVPATHVPGRAPVRPSAFGAAVMRHALRSDLLFWAGMQLAEDQLIATLLATDPALVYASLPAEQARVRAILHGILPVSAKTSGLLNDAALAGNPVPMDLASITAPTLAISMEDDRFGTYAAARHIAETVNGARLFSFPSGGHVWVGHDTEVFAEIDDFLRKL